MKLTIPNPSLCLIPFSVRPCFAEDAAPKNRLAISPSLIETIIPNRSYALALDCISCPYLIRHSNRNEWENDPRPSQLTLALYIDGPQPRLYLQGESLSPLCYERRAPGFYNLPRPFAPPFTANQVAVNATLQQKEENNKYGFPIRQFELAYEFDAVIYAPKDRVQEWEVLIDFEITGLRHEEHVPEDIPFLGGSSDQETKGAVLGVTSIIRLVLGYTALEEMQIMALELIPKKMMATHAGIEIQALRKAAELKEEKSIATTNWSGRLHDIIDPNSKDVYRDHVSFKPGEWNDCGRKNELGRQIMCDVEDLRAHAPMLFAISLIFVTLLLVGFSLILLLIVSAPGMAFQFLLNEKFPEGVTAEGEDDVSILAGDEELEEEDHMARTEVQPPPKFRSPIDTGDWNVGQGVGPCPRNAGTEV